MSVDPAAKPIAPPTGLAAGQARRLPWIAMAAVPALGLGYQFCAREIAEATKALPFGLAWLVAVTSQPLVALVVLLEIGSLIAWTTVLSRLPISAAFPLTAISYGVVVALGWFAFHEPILPLQLVGAVAVLIGVYLLGSGAHEQAEHPPAETQ